MKEKLFGLISTSQNISENLENTFGSIKLYQKVENVQDDVINELGTVNGYQSIGNVGGIVSNTMWTVNGYQSIENVQGYILNLMGTVNVCQSIGNVEGDVGNAIGVVNGRQSIGNVGGSIVNGNASINILQTAGKVEKDAITKGITLVQILDSIGGESIQKGNILGVIKDTSNNPRQANLLNVALDEKKSLWNTPIYLFRNPSQKEYILNQKNNKIKAIK